GKMSTPLARGRGLGAARSGTDHFWRQRLTAVANAPLSIAFVLIVVALLGRNHAAVAQILGSPLLPVIMLLFIFSLTTHMRIGMQVIIEDCVQDEGGKLVLVMANAFFAVVVALASAFAVLMLSFKVCTVAASDGSNGKAAAGKGPAYPIEDHLYDVVVVGAGGS